LGAAAALDAVLPFAAFCVFAMDYPIVIGLLKCLFGEQKCRGNLRSRQLANAKKRIKDAFGGIPHALAPSEASFLPA
jgi:hypothetical protein